MMLCLLCLPCHAAAGLLCVCAIDLRPSLSCPFQLFFEFSRIAFFLVVLIVCFGFQLESGADFERQVINSLFLSRLVPFGLSVVNTAIPACDQRCQAAIDWPWVTVVFTVQFLAFP